MDRQVVRDAALLILRATLGVVFIAHGFDRFFLTGLTETTGQVSAWGVPQPKFSAFLVAIAEMIGGALLTLGLLTTFFAGALALLVLAAIYFVHLPEGFSGLELPVVMIAALITVLVFGAGRASLDEVLSRAEL